ncbi:MAG: MFS transporter [Halobacteriales archaeon]
MGVGVTRLRAIAGQLALDTRARVSWGLYDWAISAFSTTILGAVFPVYYVNVAGATLPGNRASVIYGYTLALGFVIIALLSPVLGAAADYSGAVKRSLVGFVGVGVLGTGGLFLVERGDWLLASALMVPAMIGFSGSWMFYNSLLPHLADDDEIDALSAGGWALGFVGGGLLLGLNAAWIAFPGAFGLGSTEMASRVSMLSVAVWWGLFTLPLIRYVPEPEPEGGTDAPMGVRESVRAGFGRLRTTLGALDRYRELGVFLLAFWLYHDGLNSLLTLAGAFGAEIGLGETSIIGAILMVQFVAVPFTLGFGQLPKYMSTRAAITVGLVVCLGVTLGAYLVTTAWQYFVLAFLVATALGGIQSLSRSLYGTMIPPDRSSEFYAFYNVSAKFASVLGPLLFATVGDITGSTRIAMVSLSVLFVTGLIVLWRVDVSAARELAQEPSAGVEDG